MDETNLRAVLRQRAEQYPVHYDLPASVITRTRLRLLAKAALAVTVVVAGAWTVPAVDLDSIIGGNAGQVGPVSSGGKSASAAATPDHDADGYSFSEVSVEQATQVPGNEGPRDLVLVRFEYAWKTEAFPGFRDCLFTVYGATGGPIGERRRLLVFEEPEGSSLREVDVEGDPSSAQIECGPRLPDPGSRYEITDVHVDGASPWEVVVTFDTLWVGGGGPPGESRCVGSVFDAKGTPIIAEEFTFLTEADRRDDTTLSLEAPSAVGERAASAEIVCY